MQALRRIAVSGMLVVAIGTVTTLPVNAQDTAPKQVAVPNQVTTPTKVKIKIGDNYFKPKTVTITTGDTVVFQWTGTAIHDVKVKKGPQKFDSQPKASGKFSQSLLKPGKYQIVCTLHPGMEMKLTAELPPPVTTSSAPPLPPAS